jgi:hypothetical protein
MNHNPNLCLCYHVSNNICIHLRTGCPNIYMYMKGEMYKETLKKNIIIEKANIHLTGKTSETQPKWF